MGFFGGSVLAPFPLTEFNLLAKEMIIRLLQQWKFLDELDLLGSKVHSKSQLGHYQLPFVEILQLLMYRLRFLLFLDRDLKKQFSNIKWTPMLKREQH